MNLQKAQLKLPLSSEENNQALTLAILLSLLLHLILLTALPRLNFNDAPSLSEDGPEVLMIEELRSEGQLVELNRPAEDLAETPNSRWLSDANRKVDSETQASVTGPQILNRPPIQTSQPGKDPSSAATPERRNDSDSFSEPIPKPQNRELRTDLPPEWLAALSPPSPSNYLPNIALGDETLLSTREYAYAPFFIRMKQSLERVWNPQEVLKYESRAARSEYRTALEIVLNANGSLYSVRISVSSTFPALDQEAVRAVRKAAPFVNPPKDLIERNGRITIPNFFFIISQRPSLF